MSKFWRLSMISVLAAAAMLLSRAASAQEQDFSKVQIKVSKVSGNIYMLEGAAATLPRPSAKTESSLWTISSPRWRTKSRPR